MSDRGRALAKASTPKTEGERNLSTGTGELKLDEIIEDAMTFLDFGPEVMTCAEPDGYFCDMEPEKLELARASIVYLGYRLLLMFRIKNGNVIGNPGGWVGVRHYESEIRKDIARALGIRGAEHDRIDEVRRLYKAASEAEDKDEAYGEKLRGILESFEERYDLDPESLGILFV